MANLTQARLYFLLCTPLSFVLPPLSSRNFPSHPALTSAIFRANFVFCFLISRWLELWTPPVSCPKLEALALFKRLGEAASVCMDHQTLGRNFDETLLANAHVKNGSGAALHGWKGIEEHLMNNDEGRMKGYSEDIDNLLFFAGLFSAILTAFAQQSYQLLQPDSMETTNQLLAYALAERASSSSAHPRILARITNILATENTFIPSTSARWINALFFISLVLGLAAALLGILAKQWLREYMHWNSPLALPRENILVREMRYEAWQLWNVEATISAIPALLEVAMILFLVGIIILLWTLDDVVAIAVTVVIAAFLLVVAVFTVLPVFSDRCPYKSPTAWALVTAFHVLPASITWISTNVRVLQQRWKRLASDHPDWHPRDVLNDVLRGDSAAEHEIPYAAWPSALPKTWRERDMKTCRSTDVRIGEWWSRSLNALPAAKSELAKEKLHLSQDGQLMGSPQDQDVPDEAAQELVAIVTEIAFLLRALSWVQRSSQDVRVGTYIAQAVESIRRDISKDAAARWSSGIYATANWCIIASLQDGTIHQPHLALFHGLAKHSRTSITDVRAELGVSMSDDQLAVPSCNERSWLAGSSQAGVHAMLARMLAADFHRFSTDVTGTGSTLRVRRMMELYAIVSEHDISVPFPEGERGPAGLRPLINAQPRSCPAGARSLVFYMACQLARVTVDAKSKKLVTCRGSMEANDYEGLLLYYFDSPPKSWTVDHLDMFVHAASGWLLKEKSLSASEEVTKIIAKMVKAGEALLKRSASGVPSVRHVDDEEWLYGLSVHIHKELPEALRAPLRTLLHTFERLFLLPRPKDDPALLGDRSRMSAYLHDGLHALHESSERCKDAACRWAAHRCAPSEDYLDCALLRTPCSADGAPSASCTRSDEHLPSSSPGSTNASVSVAAGRSGGRRALTITSPAFFFDSPAESAVTTPLDESPILSRQNTGARFAESASAMTRAARSPPPDAAARFGEPPLENLNVRDAAQLFSQAGSEDQDGFSTGL
ncbi:hypothetical protein PsYK624_109440 [Phanerochaete sordida]|uniref:DUF6535 domain-containing protein n=1 Tax=Phanerochaete sordida TaxID=48140 RepID=A0A9P3GGZ1_9APHY|nr:hypothetical protein PsYK624_109440 [Phanerochaete sordida]